MRVKDINGKKFKKVNWPLLIGIALSCVLAFVIPFIKVIPLGVQLILCAVLFLGGMISILVMAFSDKSLYKKLDKFSKTLNARCWTKAADSPFPQLYLFDLDNCYVYGLFAWNPYCLQKLDLREVKDVEIIYSAHQMVPLKQWSFPLNEMSDVEKALGEQNEAINSGIVCRLHLEGGQTDICLWHDRKINHLPVGHPEELKLRESGIKFKKFFADLKTKGKGLRG